ncbi:MAG: hypothetical protein J0G96_09095 [Flavobacteriia bacterium]|nr:hypothetical protein [Flavobacteriia bacterium]
MKKLFYLMMGALAILTSACTKEDSSDVNQNKIYCDYELFYNANEDKTHVVARFRFGGLTGTILELTDSSGASVKFNGDILPYNHLYTGHHKEYAGQLTTGTFVYTNTAGNVFTNTVPSGATIAFPSDLDTIRKSIANTVTWVGPALSANEYAGIYIGTPAWGKDALFFNSDLGGTNIVMGVSQKANLTLGNATLVMDRKTTVNVTEGTEKGGQIRYRYRCPNKAVVIVN